MNRDIVLYGGPADGFLMTLPGQVVECHAMSLPLVPCREAGQDGRVEVWAPSRSCQVPANVCFTSYVRTPARDGEGRRVYAYPMPGLDDLLAEPAAG
jgi:hypothetical protein